MKKKAIYNKAKQVYGIDAQVTKAVEELSELQKELCRFLIDDGTMKNIIEEIADVKVMIEQLEMIFECKDKVKLIKKSKIQRLLNRIDEEEKNCKNCLYFNGGDFNITCVTCKKMSDWKMSDWKQK